MSRLRLTRSPGWTKVVVVGPAAAAVALTVGGCGGSHSASRSTTTSSAAPTMSTAAPTTSSPGTTTSSSGASTTTAAPTAGATTTIPVGLRTHATPIGSVLATASGYTVYELVGATASQSPCRGACLSVWPAVTVNGKQVVVDGHPGYTFVGDTAPGQAKGQGLRDTWGLWLALDPAGQPITGKAASSTTTTSSGYGSP